MKTRFSYLILSLRPDKVYLQDVNFEKVYFLFKIETNFFMMKLQNNLLIRNNVERKR